MPFPSSVALLIRGLNSLANVVSAQVIAVDAPAYVNSDNAAKAANPEGGHESAKLGSYPPSNPAEDHHANEDAEPVHILSVRLELRQTTY